MPDFEKFQKKIGITFNDESILRQAFTHRSYINENRNLSLGHNERLEFLGDAVLELITTEFLYAKYPDDTEGSLTSYRAGLVNTSTLSTVATGLGMNEFLLLSKGEMRDTGRARQYILANTFEAFVGALFLDKGYDEAKKFVTDHLLQLTQDIVEKRLWHDAKSRFQEIAQEKSSTTPTYELISAVGPDHDRHFTVRVVLGTRPVGEGEGKSKQEAEQAAAADALKKTGWG